MPATATLLLLAAAAAAVREHTEAVERSEIATKSDASPQAAELLEERRKSLALAREALERETAAHVRPPESFADREDLVSVWAAAGNSVARARRVFGAAIGFCFPEVAKAAGADYAELDYDGMRFGGVVYDFLRAQGVTNAQAADVAGMCYRACLAALYPRSTEVEKREGFTEGSGAPGI